MALERRTVDVWADWYGLPCATRVGVLYATPSRGKEIFSFEYDRGWLDAGYAQSLDPALQLVRGPQYVATGGENFGVFLDSSPDRWGRVLMQRREAQLARETKRSERKLFELDYLLGVYDGHRMGALRYRMGEGPFLDDNTELASPPWTSLRELEQASLALERPGAERDPAGRVTRARAPCRDKRANEIIAGVVTAVRGWRVFAKKLGLSRGAQDRMAAAFQLAEAA